MLELFGVIIFFVGLALSIGLHEVGHLLPAKKFGVLVSQYMIGFGPTIWSKVKGETEYGFKAIPMGGYIRMIGMFPPRAHVPESLGRIGTMIEEAREDSLAAIPEGSEARAFYLLSAPRKLIIMLGGPVMNLLLAIAFFLLSFTVLGHAMPGRTVSALVACVPTSANPDGIVSTDGGCGEGQVSPAVTAGIRAGDQLLSIGDTKITSWESISDSLRDKQGQWLSIVVMRDGKQRNLRAHIAQTEGEINPRAFLGISPELEMTKISAGETVAMVGRMARSSVHSLAQFPASVAATASNLFSSEPRDATGPVSVVGIGRISGDIASADLAIRDKVGSYLDLLGSLNLFLFMFNLVPLLPLDGGHVAGAIYEGVRRAIARMRGRTATGPADTARMLPVAYFVSLIMLGASLIIMLADVVKPISFG